MTRVPEGHAMRADLLNKLGQASLVTEWGRQQHSFVRYGIGAAQVVAGTPQASDLMAVLDAAAAAGVYVLINLGVDALAQIRLGKPRHLGPNITAEQMWMRRVFPRLIRSYEPRTIMLELQTKIQIK